MPPRKRALDELDQDIRDHIERETQDNVEKGMAPEEARRQALLAFGNVVRVREDVRAVWVPPSLDALRQDLRYAFRTLRRNPTFAAVVVLTLGLGIGVNTATFSIVNAALIRPLGFAAPERLVALHERLGDERPLLSAGLPGSRARPAVVRGLSRHSRTSRSSSPGAASRSGSTEPRCRRSSSRCSACGRSWAATSPPTRTGPAWTSPC